MREVGSSKLNEAPAMDPPLHAVAVHLFQNVAIS